MGTTEKIDITGLMTKPVDGWQERVKQFCKAEHFAVKIIQSAKLRKGLTLKERRRLAWKLDLVATAARYMAAGMLKGTLKYPKDDYTLEQWIAHVVGEGADQMNYQLLLFDRFYNHR